MFVLDFFDVIRQFLERGGMVLWAIFATLLVMWTLIVERFIYYRAALPQDKQRVIDEWNQRKDHSSWYAHQIRQQLISHISKRIYQNVAFIKTLVAVCPLLGLLGTVTGMIAVFDVMAQTGTGNARLMASGISLATIPTMSGMVAAISGLYFGNLLDARAKHETQEITDALPLS